MQSFLQKMSNFLNNFPVNCNLRHYGVFTKMARWHWYPQQLLFTSDSLELKMNNCELFIAITSNHEPVACFLRIQLF